MPIDSPRETRFLPIGTLIFAVSFLISPVCFAFFADVDVYKATNIFLSPRISQTQLWCVLIYIKYFLHKKLPFSQKKYKTAGSLQTPDVLYML